MKTNASLGVFITGGCGDIGRAVAAKFLETGALVVLADRTISLGRLCSADEVVGSFVFLAGEAGAYITGQSILIDGGATLVRRDS